MKLIKVSESLINNPNLATYVERTDFRDKDEIQELAKEHNVKIVDFGEDNKSLKAEGKFDDIITFYKELNLIPNSSEEENEEVKTEAEEEETLSESSDNEPLTESYLDNLKNPGYWQHQVDYQIEKFGRVGGGLIQDLDEAGFYLDKDNKVTSKAGIKENCLTEDTIKQGNKWVNKGKDGTHGEFKTKKAAEDQRKAMFANGFSESLTEDIDDLDKATPYMLRNDGNFKNVSPIHPYIKYGHETAQQALDKLADFRLPALKWFYENTRSADTRQLIGSVVKFMISSDLITVDQGNFCKDLNDVYLPKKEEIAGFIDELADNTNQEFCRVRTSGILFRGNSNDIYFRISSIRFNWFDLIWSIVNKYKNFISAVTICKDSNTFGGRFEPYKVSGVAIDGLPTQEFLELPGTPVLEHLKSSVEAINESNNLLMEGKLISESYDKQLHPIHVHSFYESQRSEFLIEDIEHLLSKSNNQALTEDVDSSEEKKDEKSLDPPEAGDPIGVANLLNMLIKSEWDAIEDYNSAIQTLTGMNFDETILNIIKDIVGEEHVHIGQLQKALETVSPNAVNIQEGEKEATEQLQEPVYTKEEGQEVTPEGIVKSDKEEDQK